VVNQHLVTLLISHFRKGPLGRRATHSTVGASAYECHVGHLVDLRFLVASLKRRLRKDVVVLDEVVTPGVSQRKRQAGPPILRSHRFERELRGREQGTALASAARPTAPTS
jgi:hypothetical protein